MRLWQPFRPLDRVQQITLRIRADQIPADAHIDITDIRLQPGTDPTDSGTNPLEAGTRRAGYAHRNGVVHDGQELVVLANVDQPSPARLEVRNTLGDTRIGGYRFGTLRGEPAHADAMTHQASHGHGRPPVLTPRADLPLNVHIGTRAHLRLTWEERE